MPTCRKSEPARRVDSSRVQKARVSSNWFRETKEKQNLPKSNGKRCRTERNSGLKEVRQCTDGILPRQPVVSIQRRKGATRGPDFDFTGQTVPGTSNFSLQGLRKPCLRCQKAINARTSDIELRCRGPVRQQFTLSWRRSGSWGCLFFRLFHARRGQNSA